MPKSAPRTRLTNKRVAIWTATAVVVALVVFAIAGPWIGWFGTQIPQPAGVAPPAGVVTTVVGGVTTTVVQPAAPTAKDAAVLQFTVQGQITKAASADDTDVIIVKADNDGTIDFSTRLESVEVDATAPKQSSQYFREGDLLILIAHSDQDFTGGTDAYDQWYYVTVRDGEQVRYFSPDILTATSTDPYKYKITGTGAKVEGSKVTWTVTTGGGHVWDAGRLYVVERSTAANMDTSVSWAGNVMASISDGSTWITTQAGQTRDFTTLTTDDETFVIYVEHGAVGLAYGTPLYTLSSSYKLEKRVAIAFFTTNATGIGQSKLNDKGWYKVNDPTLTADLAFYKVISEFKGTSATKGSIRVEIPIDASGLAASTAYDGALYLIDCQLEASAAQGTSSSSVPTAYGALNEFGIDALIFARPYTTSSNAPSSMVLLWDWKTTT